MSMQEDQSGEGMGAMDAIGGAASAAWEQANSDGVPPADAFSMACDAAQSMAQEMGIAPEMFQGCMDCAT